MVYAVYAVYAFKDAGFCGGFLMMVSVFYRTFLLILGDSNLGNQV